MLHDWLLGEASKVSALMVVRQPVAFAVSAIQQAVKGLVPFSKLCCNSPTPNFQKRTTRAERVLLPMSSP